MIREYLRSNILLTDGAMGTYYAQKSGDYSTFSEIANIDKADMVKNIHREYIEAGAKLIRTNTFSANCKTLGISRDKVKEILVKGVLIAKEAANEKETFIAASIGPIPEVVHGENSEDVLSEYKFIVDTFIEQDINIFMFETFSSIDYLQDIVRYIRNKNSNAFIITQFAIMPSGYTRDGISISGIVREAKQLEGIDVYGFNCGSGPTHLYKFLKNLNIFSDNILVLPNSGYPEIINNRTVYVNNPEYFASKMIEIKNLGAKIIGGCCGTTPEHIKSLKAKLKIDSKVVRITYSEEMVKEEKVKKEKNNFYEKLNNNKFVVAVELDPPFDTSINKIMAGAKICKDNEVDLVTVADSPMSKVRVDSVMIAAKIKREIGIDTMPHLCCRDKNINALRSSVLAAHIEGIRNILAVTGDPVSSIEKMEIKSVFNLNSFKLIELITQMNKEVFNNDAVSIGGALNLNILNKNLEVDRMYKKNTKGATFFLTQPIYDDKTIEFLSKMKRDKNIKILGGIMPLVSYKNAQFINNELPGVNIPEHFISRFSTEMSKEEAEEVGINMAVEIANKISGYVDGLYLMTPFNRFEMIMKILRKIRNN